ncbi:hypothetical protein PP707_01485 [Acetobacter pasteurianus]|nr:hypothetical protein [Acetobacter pasteurianus]
MRFHKALGGEEERLSPLPTASFPYSSRSPPLFFTPLYTCTINPNSEER